jgi:hypothetical protein
MGVTTEIQQTPTATNVLAMLNGTDSDKTVLLVAHYDTVANSPGAGDNTSSVAALIETTRALKARGPSKNNIMVLFSDNEETGLYGAKAFVHSPDRSKDIGIVLNFEARGSRGASLMFETSSHNEWLIREFSIAAPYPVASSLMYSIYRTLPNDTDFTIFRDAGFQGLNFAFIDGYKVYHTPQDTVDRLDERSVQHHGSYALALSHHFASIDLNHRSEGDAIFFNVPGLAFIYYPSSWVLPITSIVAFIFLITIVIGLKTHRLSIEGIGMGMTALLASMLIAPLVVSILAVGIDAFDTGSSTALPGYVAITVAITSACYTWFWKNATLENLFAGALSFWLIFLALSTIFLPEGSYFFAWPLLSGLIILLALITIKPGPRVRIAIFLLISMCSVVAILITCPIIYLTFLGVGLRVNPLLVIAVVALCGLLTPFLNLVFKPGRWTFPLAAAIGGIGLVLVEG